MSTEYTVDRHVTDIIESVDRVVARVDIETDKAVVEEMRKEGIDKIVNPSRVRLTVNGFAVSGFGEDEFYWEADKA